jgi:hypothetical protein
LVAIAICMKKVLSKKGIKFNMVFMVKRGAG